MASLPENGAPDRESAACMACLPIVFLIKRRYNEKKKRLNASRKEDRNDDAASRFNDGLYGK